MLACAFALIVEGNPPSSITNIGLCLYSSFLGISTGSLAVSLWCGFIVFRRINKFKITTEFDRNEYHRYYTKNCRRVGGCAIVFVCIGSICLFATATVYSWSKFNIYSYDDWDNLPF